MLQTINKSPLLFENRPLFFRRRGKFPPYISVSKIDTAEGKILRPDHTFGAV